MFVCMLYSLRSFSYINMREGIERDRETETETKTEEKRLFYIGLLEITET